jgi:hypothetical protein
MAAFGIPVGRESLLFSGQLRAGTGTAGLLGLLLTQDLECPRDAVSEPRDLLAG